MDDDVVQVQDDTIQDDVVQDDVVQVQDDVVITVDPGITKKKFFLICESQQVYLKLDEEYYLFLDKLLPLINGQYTLGQIKEKMDLQDNETVDKAIAFF